MSGNLVCLLGHEAEEIGTLIPALASDLETAHEEAAAVRERFFSVQAERDGLKYLSETAWKIIDELKRLFGVEGMRSGDAEDELCTRAGKAKKALDRLSRIESAALPGTLAEIAGHHVSDTIMYADAIRDDGHIRRTHVDRSTLLDACRAQAAELNEVRSAFESEHSQGGTEPEPALTCMLQALRMLREQKQCMEAGFNTLIGQRDEARAQLAQAQKEIERYQERERHFAEVLRVTDGGQYRADWNSAIERVVKERDAAQEKLAQAERDRDALQQKTEGLTRYQWDSQNETCDPDPGGNMLLRADVLVLFDKPREGGAETAEHAHCRNCAGVQPETCAAHRPAAEILAHRDTKPT